MGLKAYRRLYAFSLWRICSAGRDEIRNASTIEEECFVILLEELCTMKKIGILGSGIVGQTLAGGFIKYGYPVTIGSGNASKLDAWKSTAGKGAATGTFEEAARFGEILVLAVKGDAAEDVMKKAGLENFSGKTVIDTTNPIAPQPPVNGVLRYFTEANHSLMEKLQALAPKARMVKAFNSVGNAFMVDPAFPGGKPTMFICGNDAAAKSEVTEILTRFGHETEDMGMAEAAGTIESLCILWCIPGFLRNQWTHAFRLLKM